jgi:hypothetical protein
MVEVGRWIWQHWMSHVGITVRQFIRKVFNRHAERPGVRSDRRCEKTGFRIINNRTRAFGLNQWLVTLVAKDVDVEAGVAAVLLVERLKLRKPIVGTYLYEHDGQAWRSVGGCSGPRGVDG